MKKGIKYAGIAAATLLTVAPVVAPVVGSTTQTVQAADANNQKDNSTDSKNVSAFFTQFASKKIDAKTMNAIATMSGYNQDVNYTDFAKGALNASFYGLRSNTVNGDLKMDNAKVNVIALNDQGAVYSASDLKAIFANGNTPDSITLKYTVKYNDKDGKAQSSDNTYTFTTDKTTEDQSSKVEQAKQINATFTTPYIAAVDSSTLDVKLSPSTDLSLTNQNGKAIKVSNITLGGLFNTYSAAKASTPDAKGDYTYSTFKEKGKKYYQAITATVAAGDLGKVADKEVVMSDITTGYQNGTDGYAITINGKDAVANQYVTTDAQPEIASKPAVPGKPAVPAQPAQPSVTGKGDAQPAIPGKPAVPAQPAVPGQDAEPNTITFVREITVGDKKTTPEWTTEKISGQVHTNNKQVPVILTDGTTGTRSLERKTDWITNEKRTNAKGEVQYKVSTSEWVSDSDVTFTADSEKPAEGALTDITVLEGKHTVKINNKNMVYTLFLTNGKQATRGLSGDTLWATDKTAKNAEGKTMYRVSTDEWLVAGDGVEFN